MPRFLPLLVIAGVALVLVVSLALIFSLPRPPNTPSTITTSVATGQNTSGKNRAIVQLSDSSDGRNMAVLVAISYTENIPRGSYLKLMLVDKKGQKLMDEVATVNKPISIYEFVIPTNLNDEVCRGRPLYVSVEVSTPKGNYEYRGELPEWRGIETMCLPFK
ncbi:MAG: hypothetical protein QW420_03040 [Candidatus Caldarchaeum sp.]